jgi:UDP-N-acetylmuramoyl-L-alanyl-D-glutamate--2,6-diaminopimelate ligase
MDLERLAAALAPVEVVGRGACEVEDLAYDARAVGRGSVFFCVRGGRADGHDFAAEAVASGAVALVVERRLDLDVPQLIVADVRSAMPRAAVAFFGDPTLELEVAGVTGTSGKTTTTFLLYAILAAAGRRPGLVGTVEARIGGERRKLPRTTPEAIDLQRLFREMLDSGDRSVAVEASSHASAQGRLDGTRFSALVFTNLSQDHLDFHADMDEYFRAKRALFGDGVPAVVNVGDPWGARLADELPDAVRFSTEDVEDLELDARGARFTVGGLDLETRLRGRFNVENVLGAVAAARLLGIGEEAIKRGVESLRGVPGRFETIDEGQPFGVIVDYAHKPDALDKVLRAARDLTAGKLIVVFGCGGDRDRAKRPLMGRTATALADRVIVTSDNPRSEEPEAIIAEILTGAPGAEVEPDRAAAIELALGAAGDGDVVVIAGKGHEQGQEIAGEVVPFDDRAVAAEVLRRLPA